MRPLMLTLGATIRVGAPALIALVLLPAQVHSQELKYWITASGLDTVTLLFGLVAVLLLAAALGVMFATRARRRERQSQAGRTAQETAHEVSLAPWIEEGRQLFHLWQDKVEAGTSYTADSPR